MNQSVLQLDIDPRLKQRVRIITTAWSRHYLDELLQYALPALLAPGNLPILAEAFDCDLVLVTESAFFTEVRQAPVLQHIESICKVHLVPLDDLVMTRHHYGLTLTYAYRRGFEDLGQAVTNCFLIFLNSDFILADGCYRTLVRLLLAGKRLVVAPSYCVLKENVAPFLRYECIDPVRQVLALQPRHMAELAIANRHYTIRGKTVNQQLYSMDRIEQFYWCVDEHTLLAHQLPIAVVCMKPERVVTDLPTFWDYGLISEMCPTTPPCVVQDSDDFLMIELRSANTYEEFLSLGWPSVDEIAQDLSSFTTKDHRDYGRYTLVLHARDLPSSFQVAKTKLRAFVDEVYARLSPEPVSHLHHPYWQSSVADFERGKAEWRRRNRPSEINTVWDRAIGKPPRLRRIHPLWSDLRIPVEAFKEFTDRTKAKILLVRNPMAGSLLEPVVRAKCESCVIIDSFLAENDLLNYAIGPVADFDICLVEVNLDDLRKFPLTYQYLRRRLNGGGRMIFFYRNTYARPIARKNLPMLKPLFTNGDQSAMYFAGNKWSRLAAKLFDHGQTFPHRGYNRLIGWAGFLVLTTAGIGLSCLTNWTVARQSAQQPSPDCTTVTIVIDVSHPTELKAIMDRTVVKV